MLSWILWFSTFNQLLVIPSNQQCPLDVIKLAQRTTVDSIRARGYEAQNYKVITRDGYVLNLVRASNPLIPIPTREPMLFVHGSLCSSKLFCGVPGQYKGSLAKNYANIDINALSEQQINRLLVRDPASQSLVWLALNFGHLVWLLDRRGSGPSLGHVKPDKLAYLPATGKDRVSRELLQDIFGDDPLDVQFATYRPSSEELDELAQTINPKYWSFSLDEQTKYDIPAVTDYILERSEFQKLVYVGHSVGSALALTALIEEPQLADKFSKLVLWAPSFYRNVSGSQQQSKRAEALREFTGPNIPTEALSDLQTENGCMCVTYEQQHNTCPSRKVASSGALGDQVKIGPEIASIPNSNSVWEQVQNNEMRTASGKLRKFDYGSDRANIDHYGQKDPPEYNATKIISKSISLWYGVTDTVASDDLRPFLLEDLRVPVEVYRIGNISVDFSHSSFFIDHKHKAQLLTIPSLKFIAKPL